MPEKRYAEQREKQCFSEWEADGPRDRPIISHLDILKTHLLSTTTHIKFFIRRRTAYYIYPDI